MSDNVIDQLIDGLRCLPGVGPKSAQRMALHLLQRDRDSGKRLGQALVQAMERIRQCNKCRNFTENDLCDICSDSERDDTQLCIVESPADVIALEKSTGFKGRYFVLMGHLSPLDGIGPVELGLGILEENLDSGAVKELTIATNPTVEGSATANYISVIVPRFVSLHPREGVGTVASSGCAGATIQPLIIGSTQLTT